MIVTSKPISASTEIIRPLIRLSTSTLNYTDISSEPAIYVHLRKGESPIKRATVKVLIEDPQGAMTCELNLLDNGVGKFRSILRISETKRILDGMLMSFETAPILVEHNTERILDKCTEINGPIILAFII